MRVRNQLPPFIRFCLVTVLGTNLSLLGVDRLTDSLLARRLVASLERREGRRDYENSLARTGSLHRDETVGGW